MKESFFGLNGPMRRPSAPSDFKATKITAGYSCAEGWFELTVTFCMDVIKADSETLGYSFHRVLCNTSCQGELLCLLSILYKVLYILPFRESEANFPCIPFHGVVTLSNSPGNGCRHGLMSTCNARSLVYRHIANETCEP